MLYKPCPTSSRILRAVRSPISKAPLYSAAGFSCEWRPLLRLHRGYKAPCCWGCTAQEDTLGRDAFRDRRSHLARSFPKTRSLGEDRVSGVAYKPLLLRDALSLLSYSNRLRPWDSTHPIISGRAHPSVLPLPTLALLVPKPSPQAPPSSCPCRSHTELSHTDLSAQSTPSSPP